MSLATDLSTLLSRFNSASSQYNGLGRDDSGQIKDPYAFNGAIDGFTLNNQSSAGPMLDYRDQARAMGVVPVRAVDANELAKARGMTQTQLFDKMYGAGQWTSQNGSDPNDGNPIIWVKPSDPQKATHEFEGMTTAKDPAFWTIPHPDKSLAAGLLTDTVLGTPAGKIALAAAGGFGSGLFGGAGAAGGLAGDAVLPGALGPTGLAGDAFLPGTLGTAGATGTETLGGGIAGDTLSSLANPLTASEIPEIYQAAPNISGGSNTLTDLLKNLPPSPPSLSNSSPEPGAQYQMNPDGSPVQNSNGSLNQIDPTTGQPISTSLPPGGSYSSLADLLKTGGQSALSKFLDIDQSTANLLGTIGTVGTGLYGASQIKDIYDSQRADRAPALAAYNSALANPNTWFDSAPARGATDAAARALSVHGNPAGNPGDIAKMASYNLNGYNSYLNNLAAPAFGGQETQAKLGTQAINQGTGALAGGLGNATTPQFDLASLLKQFQNSGGNLTWNSGTGPT